MPSPLSSDEAKEVLARRFRVQGRACASLGSSMYGDLMECAARDVDTGGPVFDLLADRAGDPARAAIPLRLFAAVHRLVLNGSARALSRFYPSTGGSYEPGAPEAVWPLFLAAVSEHAGECRAALDTPPQTNETGRTAALIVGFALAGAKSALPLRLLEIGTSAGLNLRWDHFAFEIPKVGTVGDPTSPIRIAESWYPEGFPIDPATLLPGILPPIASRSGCDRSPVDVASVEGRMTILSFVWPDQTDRFERLRGGLEIAEDFPLPIERSDALPWIEHQLSSTVRGVCTVVFHSIFLQYLASDEERDELAAVIARAGAGATPDAPLAYVRVEPSRVTDPDDRARWPVGKADVGFSYWPGGEDVVLADCGFHGYPVIRPGN